MLVYQTISNRSIVRDFWDYLKSQKRIVYFFFFARLKLNNKITSGSLGQCYVIAWLRKWLLKISQAFYICFCQIDRVAVGHDLSYSRQT